jgi:predicted Zn-ribbon and HTH transcriptional regulator
MHKRSPVGPRGRDTTVREGLHAALLAGAATAHDLSKRVGIPEHEVAGHLAHLERSLKHTGEKLLIEPPTCLDCGFAFTQRHRFTRPGGCPDCRSRRITLPQFRIES